jgi:hypothetical protein
LAALWRNSRAGDHPDGFGEKAVNHHSRRAYRPLRYLTATCALLGASMVMFAPEASGGSSAPITSVGLTTSGSHRNGREVANDSWLAVRADVPGSLLSEHLARLTGRDPPDRRWLLRHPVLRRGAPFGLAMGLAGPAITLSMTPLPWMRRATRC